MEESSKLKKRIIKWGIAFLGIVLIFTILAKTIYTFLLPRVTTERISSGKIETKILAGGKIGYDQLMINGKKIAVKAPLDGDVMECYVKEGQSVQKGDPLIKIKGTIDQAAVENKEKEAAESAINQSALNREKEEKQKKIDDLYKKIQEKQQKLMNPEKSYEVISVESQIAIKEEEVKANEELYSAGAISENDYKKAKEDLRLLREQKESLIKTAQDKIKEEIETLQDKVNDTESEIQAADDKIDLEKAKFAVKTNVGGKEVTVTSPISGIIYEMDMAVGASALNHDQLLIIMPNDIPVTLSFNVTDTQPDKVKVGEEVTWSNNQDRQSATVMKKKYDDKTGETIVTCEVAKELTKPLIPDYKTYKDVDVEVIDTSGTYDLLVSSSAIVEEGTSSFVYTIEKVETAFETTYVVHKNSVTVIKKGDQMSAISGTIQQQDEIVKTTNKPLSEGAEVSKA